MTRLIRLFVIWLAAFAIIASGAVLQPCAIAQTTQPVVVAHTTHQHHQHTSIHDSGMHDSAMHDPASQGGPIAIAHQGIHSATGHAKVPLGDHGCQKCCGLCAVAGSAPLDSGWAVARLASGVTFVSANETVRAWSMRLEPEIPKSGV